VVGEARDKAALPFTGGSFPNKRNCAMLLLTQYYHLLVQVAFGDHLGIVRWPHLAIVADKHKNR
jgi:hypothetical protein